MKEIDERLLNTLTFEVLSAERRNLKQSIDRPENVGGDTKIIIDNLRTR